MVQDRGSIYLAADHLLDIHSAFGILFPVWQKEAAQGADSICCRSADHGCNRDSDA